MSAFLEDGESQTPLDDEAVYDRVGDSLGHLHMSRSLEQITARGHVHHRRRTAATAMAGVAAVTVLGAAVAFAQQPGSPAHTASITDGMTSTTGTNTADQAGPLWSVAKTATGGYIVDIITLGDVALLNKTLTSLGIHIEVAEKAPPPGRSACPAANATTIVTVDATGAVTVTTSVTATGTATASSSSTPTGPSTPTPTPVSFAVSGTPAAFTFGALPKESTVSFSSSDGGRRVRLGTVRISDACLPVFGP
jgi:hypothetical protein